MLMLGACEGGCVGVVGQHGRGQGPKIQGSGGVTAGPFLKEPHQEVDGVLMACGAVVQPIIPHVIAGEPGGPCSLKVEQGCPVGDPGDAIVLGQGCMCEGVCEGVCEPSSGSCRGPSEGLLRQGG